MSQALQVLREKTIAEIKEELVGFPAGTLEGLLQFREEGSRHLLRELLPGFIAFHLPAGTELPPQPLADDLQLVRDFGLDSLALSEMAFKMEDVFGFRVETREVFEIVSYGDLVVFLLEKLELK